jgi:hypothetical protein
LLEVSAHVSRKETCCVLNLENTSVNANPPTSRSRMISAAKTKETFVQTIRTPLESQHPSEVPKTFTARQWSSTMCPVNSHDSSMITDQSASKCRNFKTILASWLAFLMISAQLVPPVLAANSSLRRTTSTETVSNANAPKIADLKVTLFRKDTVMNCSLQHC